MEDAGAGERMVLPTSLISPGVKKEEIASLCSTLSNHANVVVLTSSVAQGNIWVNAGAKLSRGGEVDEAIEKLRTSNKNYVVFSQRFDGVDLPDDACRILVVDGIPSGDRLSDQIDSDRQKDSPEYDIRTVNKFEQALGRAVRSSADYAAVLLVGTDLAAFVGKKSVRDLLEGRTKVQLELGRELSKMGPGKSISEVIFGMVIGLLSRNEGWKDAHRSRVRGAPTTNRQDHNLTLHEQVAVAMRASWISAKSRNYPVAVSLLREVTNLNQLHNTQKAEILYRITSYLHQFNPAEAATAYQTVFGLNSAFPRPEQVADKRFAKTTDQAVSICNYYSSFVSANAAIARLDEIRGRLSFALPADCVEQGLQELGSALGAESSRPEKETKRGPDNLWIFDDVALCLEAKSEKSVPIYKTDAAQLSLSWDWCKNHVDIEDSKIFPVFVTDVTSVDRLEDVSFGPVVLDEKSIMTLIERLKSLIVSLTYDGPLFTDPASVTKRVAELGLGGRQIMALCQKLTS